MNITIYTDNMKVCRPRLLGIAVVYVVGNRLVITTVAEVLQQVRPKSCNE